MEVITSHINLDFDGFAAMIAAQKIYPDAKIILPSVVSKDVRDFLTLYRSFFNIKNIQDIEMSKITKLIIVDTSSLKRLGEFAKVVENPDVEVIVYDHHTEEDNDIKAHYYEIRKCGACTSILLKKIIEQEIKILPVEATTLAIGIYTDTNCLTFSSTNVEDAKAVAFLLQCGAYLDVISKNVGQALSVEQKEAFEELMKNITVYNIKGFDIAISTAEFNEYIDEVAYITFKMMSRNEYDAVINITLIKNRIYIVGRSSNKKINMNSIMKEFDGAGHPKAASAKVKIQDVNLLKEKILNILDEVVEPSVIAIDIASYPVKTVSEDVLLEDVHMSMLRYGFSGMPVTNEGVVIGMVTRRDIEKAVHHGYGHCPVKAYMSKKFFSISYDTPLKEIQRVLIENNIGRLPVIKDNKLVGIVTRTDILKQIYGEENLHKFKKLYRGDLRETDENYSAELNQLNDEIREILGTIGRIGDNNNCDVYIVGGFVRDLIMDIRNLDIDIVVVGDGIKIANDLAYKYNGRIKIHEKFQTAVVEIKNKYKIDIVSARREFYEYPAALPTIEKGSIESDLYRRDFTINSMAICLNHERYGELVDYFGGLNDLKDGIIRVLHNMSFVEDPTRIFRAIRFSSRYGFKIEAQTSEYLLETIKEHILEKVSHERVSYELMIILRENDAYKSLIQMIDLKILQTLYPKLNINENTIDLLLKVVDNPERLDFDMTIIYLIILFDNVNVSEVDEILEKIKLNKIYRSIIAYYIKNKDLIISLLNKASINNYELYCNLRGFSPEALFILKNISLGDVYQKIEFFDKNLKNIRILIDGKILKELGINAGPKYKEIFRKVFEAKLNKEISTIEDEIEFVKKLIK